MAKLEEHAKLIKEVLKEVIKNVDTIQELMIMVKDKDNNKSMFHTGMSLEDKSVLIQLLQHDIFNDLGVLSEALPEDL